MRCPDARGPTAQKFARKELNRDTERHRISDIKVGAPKRKPDGAAACLYAEFREREKQLRNRQGTSQDARQRAILALGQGVNSRRPDRPWRSIRRT